MTDDVSKLEARAADLARRLTRDPGPETDLWPRIAARIESQMPSGFRQLPRAIEPGRDLWPGVRARIGTRDRRDGPHPQRYPAGTGLAAAAGVFAVATLTLMLAMRFASFGPPGEETAPADSSAAAATVALPAWMARAFGQFGDAAVGTPAAELAATASSMRRDFLMVRAERLQIEQALTESGGDMNLRAQWRQVYQAELRLIDDTEKLVSIYGARMQI